jgi:hypothetical protein
MRFGRVFKGAFIRPLFLLRCGWHSSISCLSLIYVCVQISDATIIDKVRGLFLYMWRSINKSVPRAFSERRNVSTYAGDLLSGAMLFNKRFTAAWANDGYRDYLTPEETRLESGKTVLGRLLSKGSGSDMLASASLARMHAGLDGDGYTTSPVSSALSPSNIPAGTRLATSSYYDAVPSTLSPPAPVSGAAPGMRLDGRGSEGRGEGRTGETASRSYGTESYDFQTYSAPSNSAAVAPGSSGYGLTGVAGVSGRTGNFATDYGY